jgi:hypothetical protein
MPPPNHSTRFLALAVVSAIVLGSASALAQAGLSGNAFSGQEEERLQKFDNGKLQSQSALGQLEELAGATVDRSSSSQETVTRVVPRPKPVQPRFDTNQMIKQQVAGALAEALIGALFSDNSAQEQAAAEAAAQAAAEAAAQAEAFRVQQELARQARIRQAQHYRADWDSRETEITNQLGGAFDVGTSTAFFGRPANPDADTVAAILGQDVGAADPAPGEAPGVSESDPSVVDLRGSSLVVQSLRSVPPMPASLGAPARSMPAVLRAAYELTDGAEAAPATAASSSFSVDDFRAQMRAKLDAKLQGEVKGKAIALFWDLTKGIPGQTVAKNLVELNDTRQEITDEITDSNEELFSGPIFGRGRDLVLAMGNSNRSGAELVARQDEEFRQDAGKIIRQTGKRVFQYIRSAPVKLELGEPEAAEGEEGM